MVAVYLRAWLNVARDALEDFGINISDASSPDEMAVGMGCFSMCGGKPTDSDKGMEAQAEQQWPENGGANG